MVKKEEVEQLMLRYFPSCPLCRANTGYKVSFNRLIVQCRSCGAKWQSMDFIISGGKEIRTLQLRKPDKKGKSKFLVNETKSVSFWQSLDLDRERIEKEIEELFRKLKTKEPKVRTEIQNRLREIGQPVLAKISEMSKHSYWGTRKEALWLLGLMEDERGEELLIQALKEDEKEEVRGQAITSLGLIEEAKKTGKAIEPLIEALRNDKSPNVRVVAAQLLAFMKDPRVVEPVIEALNDKEYSTRSRGTVQQWAAAALVKIGDERGIAAIAAMTPLLLGTRWIPMDYIVRLGKPAVEPLIQILKDEHREVRLKAAEALGKIKDPKAVEPLIQALKDESQDVRMKALKALREIKDPKAVEPLIQALKDENSRVREEAAYALGDIGDARALEALTQAKEDKSWFVRRAAKKALKKIQKK